MVCYAALLNNNYLRQTYRLKSLICNVLGHANTVNEFCKYTKKCSKTTKQSKLLINIKF